MAALCLLDDVGLIAERWELTDQPVAADPLPTRRSLARSCQTRFFRRTRKRSRVAVVADTKEPTPPCGACRQILWEFGGDLEVILANLHEETGRHQLRDLLPLPFDAHFLGAEGA